MNIKSFNDFTEKNLTENEVYGAPGKTKFSQWLRNVNSRVKDSMGDSYYRYYDDHNDPHKTSKTLAQLIPGAIRLVTGASAAISDFFFKGDNKENFSKLSKEDLKSKKKEVVDRWYNENIASKKVSEEDAERFYKSGVLKGKKYFGNEYNPANPKNKEEEMYTDYINDVMERYHKKLKA
jgi:hypothetical protein